MGKQKNTSAMECTVHIKVNSGSSPESRQLSNLCQQVLASLENDLLSTVYAHPEASMLGVKLYKSHSKQCSPSPECEPVLKKSRKGFYHVWWTPKKPPVQRKKI